MLPQSVTYGIRLFAPDRAGNRGGNHHGGVCRGGGDENGGDNDLYPEDVSDDDLRVPTASLEEWIDSELEFQPDLHEWYDSYTDPNNEMFILIAAAVVTDEKTAESDLEDALNMMRDEQEFNLADAAYWDETEGYAVVFVRDANLTCEVNAGRQQGFEWAPEHNLAVTAAEVAISHYRDTL